MNDLNKRETITSMQDSSLKSKKQKTGRLLAFTALFFALFTLIVIVIQSILGYTYIEDKVKKFQVIDLNQQNPKRTMNEEKILELLSMQESRLDSLQNLNNELKKEIAENRQVITQLNHSFNEIIKGRYQWLLNEAEYGLNIVVLQLVNTGNIEAAINSLINIELRLKTFNYPELVPLKKSIAQDIENLKSVNVANKSATLVALDVLNTKVDNLPLLIESNLVVPTNNETFKKSLNPSWYVKVWEDFITTIKSGIQIRTLKSSDPMLLSPEQAYFIKENLKLKLLDTRLALLQGQQDTYLQSLDSIRSTVKEYFDLDSSLVEDFLEQVGELMNINIVSPNIDLIKNSIGIIKSLQSDQIISPVVIPPIENREIDPATTSDTAEKNNSEKKVNTQEKLDTDIVMQTGDKNKKLKQEGKVINTSTELDKKQPNNKIER